MSLTKNYGWTTEHGPSSCGYLAPAIMGVLEEIQPRRVLDWVAGTAPCAAP